jgi:type I restriction enzyme, S subunit
LLRRSLPKKWHATTLELHGEIRTGIAKGKRDIRDPVSRPYLRVANVQDGFLDLEEIKWIEVAPSDVERYSLKRGDVLLTEGGDFNKLGRGSVWLEEIPGCLHQNHVFAVRPNQKTLLPEFLAYQTASPYGKRYFQACSKQSTNLASINSLQLRQFPLLLPPVAEQRRIAEILRAWDEGIDKTERLIAAKEKRLRSMMANSLAVPHDKRTIKRAEWVKTTLGEILTTASRRVNWDEAAIYRLITVKRACGGLVFRGDRKGSDILTKDMYLVRAGDFVISRRQVVHGAWAMAIAKFDGAHVSKEYACLEAKRDRLWMPYFDWLSRTPEVRHLSYICSYGVDIEKMVLNLGWLLRSEIVIPRSVERQKEIANALDCAAQELQLHQRQLAALQGQKRGLMQKLLAGEWAVPLRDGEVDELAQHAALEAAE